MDSVRTRSQIEDVLARVNDKIAEGGSRYFGQTYEEGVQMALDWILGTTNDDPYPEE